MKLLRLLPWVLGVCSTMNAQVSGDQTQPLPPQTSTATAEAPPFIRFTGYLNDANGKPLSGLVSLRFAVYKDEASQSPLWVESQNVNLYAHGYFSVLLGSSSAYGIPTDIFASREARWIGVSTEDGVERSRVVLTSVAYALEALDAQTIGGKRPEDFVSVSQLQSSPQKSEFQWWCPMCGPPPLKGPTVEATSPNGPSFISDATTGPPFQVNSPELVPNLNANLLQGLSASAFAQAALTNQFSLTQLFNQGISLEAAKTTGTSPQSSPPLDFKSRVFDSASNAMQDRVYRWQSEPPTSSQSPSDALSLLFGLGSNAPTQTGLSINPDGTFNFASNQVFPQSAGSFSGPETNSNSYQWNQTITGTAIAPGVNTISLTSCPPGVNAADPNLYVYISGTGTPEAVLVTGGTCKGDGKPGTLQFTAANVHPSGYTVSSATSGIEESLSASNAKSQSGNIVVPPGEYAIRAPINIQMNNVTINFSGATLDCYVNASCIFIGTQAASGAQNVTLINPTGKPMVPYGTNAFIEDNGEATRLQNVAASLSTQLPNSFGTFVQVDDDQAFTLDGMDAIGWGLRCDATFCGSYVTAPGPNSLWAAVGWLKNVNLSLQCNGSAVDWQSGNGLKISDSVIQGWSLFGVRVGDKRGGYGGFISDNVYYEASPSCEPYNPYGNVGLAGLVNQGGEVSIPGPASGLSGVFPNWGAPSGTQMWLYWVVPVSSAYGDAVPLPAGYAYTNGSGPITGTFPRVAGASSYKILKIVSDGNSQPYPTGTGNYLLTSVSQSSCGAHSCPFTDNGQSLSTYSNVALSPYNIYLPLLDFWPGAVIMGQKSDRSSSNYSVFTPLLTADVLGEGAVVSTFPASIIVGQAQTMIPTTVPVTSAAGISAMNTNGSPFPGATVLKAFNSPDDLYAGYKGRVNLGPEGLPGSFFPMITLGDSNWAKTWSTPNERPSADVGDLDLGYENTISTFYVRASSEVRSYIGKLPDGNPQESLTAASKTINVPVTINGNLTVNGSCSGCGSSAFSRLKVQPFSSLSTCDSSHEGTYVAITDSTTNNWGTVITGSGSHHVLGYCDGTSWTVH